MARVWLAAIWICLSFATPRAENLKVKLGVLTDMSGIYAGWSGRGSVIAAELAAEDFRKAHPGSQIAIEITSGDHQNKADIASSLARRWVTGDGVTAILDVVNSAAALAVNAIVRDSKAAVLFSGPAHDGLTGAECSPNTVQWTFDTWSLANGTARTIIEFGGRTWYFVTADFAGGFALEKAVADVVKAQGGTIVGRTSPPLGTPDYASFLLQAQQSKAVVVGLSMGGTDFANALKQAGEFGLVAAGQRMAGLVVTIADIDGLGLRAANGLVFTEAYYWDLNDGTRDFARRFADRAGGAKPTQIQAGVYAAALHYLKAVDVSGSTDGRTAVAAMKRLPTDDVAFGRGAVRADGRGIHPMYVFEAKAPAESTERWDYYKLLRTIPAEEAFRPVDPTACKLPVP